MTTRAPSGFTLDAGPPRGDVRDGWPCIAYDTTLSFEGRPIWSGAYRLGVGHVDLTRDRRCHNWTHDEESLLYTWQRKPHADFKDKGLQATVAAKLAKQQKVAPKLDDVLYSLLSDGSAFFDAQSFEEWAGDFGYDSDSIRAKAIYDKRVEIGRAFTAALGAAKVAELRELYQDY